MTSKVSSRKKALGAFFLILLSACDSPCRSWQTWEVNTCYQEFNSSRQLLRAEEGFCTLDVALFRDCAGMRLYADTRVLYFPFDPDNPSEIACAVAIGDQPPVSVVVKRLDGGQRILFDDAATQEIVNALLAGNCVDLSIGQFRTRLIPF